MKNGLFSRRLQIDLYMLKTVYLQRNMILAFIANYEKNYMSFA